MIRRCLLALLMFLSLGAAALMPASAGAAPVEQRESHSVTKIKYPGIGIEVVRLSGAQRKLEGTSRSFKKFVKARLDVLFEEAGSKPRCAKAPTIVIKRYDSRGFASGGEGSYGPCAGGGYAILYKHSASGWEPILGTQDARYCQDLAFYGVTDFIGGPQCVTEQEKVVRYHLAGADTVSPEASGRRVEGIASGFPLVPSDDVLTPAAAEQLAVVIARKGYLNVDACFRAGDAGELASHLGDAPYGCAGTATYKKGKAESIMLRMDDDFVVTELFEF